MKSYRLFAAVLAVALVLSLGLGALLNQQATAAPLAAPTPIVSGYNSDNTKYPVLFFNTEAITQDTASAAFTLADYEAIDLQDVIDQGTTNTVTLKFQFSNDNANWVDGLSVVSASTTDQNALQQYANFGLYTRLYADVSNTNPLTITAIGVAK